MACLDWEIRNEVKTTRCTNALSSRPHYKTEIGTKTYRFYY